MDRMSEAGRARANSDIMRAVKLRSQRLLSRNGGGLAQFSKRLTNYCRCALDCECRHNGGDKHVRPSGPRPEYASGCKQDSEIAEHVIPGANPG